LVKGKVELRLCASVGAKSLGELARKAALAQSLGTDLVELRVDRLEDDCSSRELEGELAGLAKNAIITVRSRLEGGSFGGSEAERLALISALARLGPAFVDVELATVKENRRWADSLPKGVEKIVSWHDFKGTPGLEELRKVSKEALGHGQLAKVVTTATTVEDNLRTLALCSDKPGKVVSFCMGELGTISRVVSMSLGAPIAYASLPNDPIAPGQLSIPTMKSLRSLMD
jgi:3-dehydroquinate dehydratase-1